MAQPPWKRAAIVAAGPAFNLIFPVLVYFFVFVGPHEAIAPRVGSVEPGLPAAEAGIQAGDHILSVNGERVRSFSEMRRKLQPSYDRPIALEVQRNGQTFPLQLTPTRTEEYNALEKVTRGVNRNSSPGQTPHLGSADGLRGRGVGIEAFDRVLTINGQAVPSEGALESSPRRLKGN